jgi:hypothetical protein
VAGSKVLSRWRRASSPRPRRRDAAGEGRREGGREGEKKVKKEGGREGGREGRTYLISNETILD